MYDMELCGDCQYARYFAEGNYYWCEYWKSQVYTDDEACDYFIED
jgi:hypothetical protein